MLLIVWKFFCFICWLLSWLQQTQCLSGNLKLSLSYLSVPIIKANKPTSIQTLKQAIWGFHQYSILKFPRLAGFPLPPATPLSLSHPPPPPKTFTRNRMKDILSSQSPLSILVLARRWYCSRLVFNPGMLVRYSVLHAAWYAYHPLKPTSFHPPGILKSNPVVCEHRFYGRLIIQTSGFVNFGHVRNRCDGGDMRGGSWFTAYFSVFARDVEI